MATTGGLQCLGRRRSQQRTDQGKQSIRQRARLSHLSRRALGEGCEVQWRTFAPQSAPHDFDIYGNTVESVPELVPRPPDYLANRLRRFLWLATSVSHSDPRRPAPLPP